MPGLKIRLLQTACASWRAAEAVCIHLGFLCCLKCQGQLLLYMQLVSPGIYSSLVATGWHRKHRTTACEWLRERYASPVILAASGRGRCYLCY